MPPTNPLVRRLSRELDIMRSNRSTWEGPWRGVQIFIVPGDAFRSAGFPHSRQVQRVRRPRGVYDETAIDANIQLASAQFTFLTNPATKWFILRTGDETLDSVPAVRQWLDDSRDRMLNAFSRERSGFYPSAFQAYIDEGGFGTSPIFIGRLPEGGPRFQTIPIQEIFLRDDAFGRTEAVHRTTQLTYRQIGEKFGPFANRIPQFADKLADKPDDDAEVVHVVEPRTNRDTTKAGSRNMPTASIYWHVPSGTIIAEGGFRVFPYNMFFWSKRPGEAYGRGPGLNILRTVHLVNEQMRTHLSGMQKRVDPPLFAPDDAFMAPPSISAGSLSFYKQGTLAAGSRSEVIQALNNNMDINGSLATIELTRDQIRKAFHMNLLIMREADRMTATEVNQRRAEMRILSPFVSRTQQTLDGIIRRSYDIMREDMMFAPPPPELAGRLLRIEYASPMTRAQKFGEVEAFVDLTQTMAAVAPLMPEETAAAMQNFDLDAIVRRFARIFDFPEDNLKDPAEVAALREAMQQQRQLAQMAAVGKDAGAGLRDASQAVANLGAAQPIANP